MWLQSTTKTGTLASETACELMNKGVLTWCLVLVQLLCCMLAQGGEPAEMVPGTKNGYRVSPELYRSGQPDATDFRIFQAAGVKSVLNLQEYHRDTRKANGTRLQLMHYPVAASSMTLEDLEHIMLMLRRAPKPVLVHCRHGSHRTGMVVAVYRIVEQNASVEEAMAEFTDARYGYRPFWAGNLRRLLRETDWPAFKQRLNAAPPAQVND